MILRQHVFTVELRILGVASVQLTGSQADLVAAASSGNLQALNSMSTGNLAGLGGGASMSQSQVFTLRLYSDHDTAVIHTAIAQEVADWPFFPISCITSQHAL